MRCVAFLIEAPMTLRKIDTAGVEIHPTAARERIAKVVLDDLGLGFAHSEKTMKYPRAWGNQHGYFQRWLLSARK